MTMTDNNYEDKVVSYCFVSMGSSSFLGTIKFNSVIQGCMVDGEGELRLPPSKES